MGVEVVGDDRKRELRERAIAARAAQADKNEWRRFMDMLENKKRDEQKEISRIRRIESAVPTSNIDEDEIEWLK